MSRAGIANALNFKCLCLYNQKPARQYTEWQVFYMMTQTRERGTSEQQRHAAYEQWREERFNSDPRLAPLHELCADLRHFGYIREETWQYFRNEKYSRHAEALRETHHNRPDYYEYDFTTGDIIISEEIPGVKPRYTFRDMYENGLKKSQQRAENDPNFNFQLRRDQLFMDFYQDIKDMMSGQTDYDTVQVASTLPIEQLTHNKDAFDDRFYDDKEGKQFWYTVRRIDLPDGRRTMEMLTTTWYSPQSDLQAGGTDYAKQAAAAVLRAKGFDGVPFEMLPSDEYGAYRPKSTTTDIPIAELHQADTAVYDTHLSLNTHKTTSYGRTDRIIEAYEMFDHYQSYMQAYEAFFEALARNLNGESMNPLLRDYLWQLVSGYQKYDGWNKAGTKEQFLQFAKQVDQGVTPDMALIANELLDYAHSAKMHAVLMEYKQTGQLPVINVSPDILMAAYGDDASGASANAVENNKDFRDCENSNGVGKTAAAASLAEKQGISFDEALRRLGTEDGPTLCTCPFCKELVWIPDICADEIVCPDQACEAKIVGGKVVYAGKKNDPAYQNAPEAIQPSIPAPRQPSDGPRLGDVQTAPDGRRFVYSKVVSFGGASRGWVDPLTGLHLPDKPSVN